MRSLKFSAPFFLIALSTSPELARAQDPMVVGQKYLINQSTICLIDARYPRYSNARKLVELRRENSAAAPPAGCAIREGDDEFVPESRFSELSGPVRYINVWDRGAEICIEIATGKKLRCDIKDIAFNFIKGRMLRKSDGQWVPILLHVPEHLKLVPAPRDPAVTAP